METLREPLRRGGAHQAKRSEKLPHVKELEGPIGTRSRDPLVRGEPHPKLLTGSSLQQVPFPLWS